MFDETSNSKDLYDGIIISAMQGINGTTFPPVPVMKLLTLGAHAQLGLQYLFCLSVCLSVCPREFSRYEAANEWHGMKRLILMWRFS